MKKKLLSIFFMSCLGFLYIVLFPRLSLAVIYADTDGDGTTDQISICGSPAKVCVYHPNTGQTNYYWDAYWQSFAINKVVDTDGIAGAEIIVGWTTSSGSNKGIDVIHDRNINFNRYDYSFANSYIIQNVKDYDGISGAEVCVYWWQSPTYYGYHLIIDRTRTVQNRSSCS